MNLEGAPIEPVISTFKVPVTLSETATAEDLPDHNIRMTYRLTEEAEIPAGLMTAIDAGTIFTFPFSYRGELTADIAFLMGGHDGGP